MAPPEPPASIPAFTRNRRQPASSTTSQTQTETNAAPHPRIAIPVGTLRLRAAAAPNDTRVRWAEDVIDNEGLGRKRSKGSSLKMPQCPFGASAVMLWQERQNQGVDAQLLTS